ncbi:MAG TPA: CopG family transcriptional regulator [Pseudacidobacterium sp.]|nr:CopG family transcriptional regulator [Pseudacidobacterium sp.]
MHRTQLYLDDDVWVALRSRAKREGTTISELVRSAVREQYLNKWDKRRKAMEAWIGVAKNRTDLPDATEYVRSLRRDNRWERLEKE